MRPAQVVGSGAGGGDLLASSSWSCIATPPGSWLTPPAGAAACREEGWIPATVPGTAAAALRDAGVTGWEDRDYDAEDWWFVTSFPAAAGSAALIELGGVATVAELWCNGALVASSESMFVPLRVTLTDLSERNDLALSCRALAPRLARRAGRPRWRSTLVERQALRMVRTSLLGRMPGWSSAAAPVGPWRPVRVLPLDRPLLVVERLSSRLGEGPTGEGPTGEGPTGEGPTGEGLVELEALLHLSPTAWLSPTGGPGPSFAAELCVGSHAARAMIEPLPIDTAGFWAARAEPAPADAPATAVAPSVGRGAAGQLVRLRARVTVPSPEPWWPHTHGGQPRLPVSLRLAAGCGSDASEPVGAEAAGTEPAGRRPGGAESVSVDLGAVGFRTVQVDERDGGFALVVNGRPVFARGACWVPPDTVSLACGASGTRRALVALRDAGCNLVRLPGTMVYEDEAFFADCDELGLMVWQDCMLANLDPPEDESWRSLLATELDANLATLASHASLATVCGGSEITQQAAMSGVPRHGFGSAVLEQQIPAVVSSLLPGVPYVSSTPTGGVLPFRCDSGVAHYFGVGAYLRPLEDARRAGVRFAAECLAFSIPPEPESLDSWGISPRQAGHHPDWKRGVPRDAGASWDFEDVTAHYVEDLFGAGERDLRSRDPARALDLRRAAVAECFAAVLAEWRRPGSGCAGAVVLSARDLWPGAGWGVLDAGGRPKAPWYVMARLLAPRALLLTDEGLNGLRLHLVNDLAEPVEGRIELCRYAGGATLLDRVGREVLVPGHGGCSLDADELAESFSDLTYAYRFGPPAHDLVVASWSGTDGGVLGEWCFLPLGRSRAVEQDLGLSATVSPAPGGGYVLDCSTERFAQHVAIEVPGYRPSDSWFHLPPGGRRRLHLEPEPEPAAEARADAEAEELGGGSEQRPPSGEVRALNLAWPVRVRAESRAAPAPGVPAPTSR